MRTRSTELTAKQRQILDFIKQNVSAKGYPPSVREIGQAVGLSSTSSVFSQLNEIERKGYISRDSMKTRAIEITDSDF